jgi:hypothetical protein
MKLRQIVEDTGLKNYREDYYKVSSDGPDVLHRDDGPAHAIYKNGKPVLEHWYQNGSTHRDSDSPACTHINNDKKTEIWYKDNVKHREGAPAQIETRLNDIGYDIEKWFFMGVAHRDTKDGPQETWKNSVGTVYKQIWLDKDKGHHREDGPSFIMYQPNGQVAKEEWKINNKLHRDSEDGPAYIDNMNNDIRYYWKGKIHRLDGPAWVVDGSSEWAVNGETICLSDDLNLPEKYREAFETAVAEYKKNNPITEAKVIRDGQITYYDHVSRRDLQRLITDNEEIRKYGMRGVYSDSLSVASSLRAHHVNLVNNTGNNGSLIIIGANRKQLDHMDHNNKFIFLLPDLDNWLLEFVEPRVYDHYSLVRMLNDMTKIFGTMKLIKANRRMPGFQVFDEIEVGQVFAPLTEAKVIKDDASFGYSQGKQIYTKLARRDATMLLEKYKRDGIRFIITEDEMYYGPPALFYHYSIASLAGYDIYEDRMDCAVVARSAAQIYSMEMTFRKSDPVLVLEDHPGWFIMLRGQPLLYKFPLEATIARLQPVWGKISIQEAALYFDEN